MKALGYGAIVWDNIPTGSVQNLQDSGEKTETEAKNLGGAVLNVLVHLERLEHQTAIVSSLGKDVLGDRAVRLLEQMGISTHWLERVVQPTPLVRVEFDKAGEPSYIIDDDISCDHIKISEADISLISNEHFDTFCFGTIEQRQAVSRESLDMLLKNVKFRYVFLDINLRPPFYCREVIVQSLEHCNILKLNLDEAAVLCELFGIVSTDQQRFVEQLRQKFDIEIVCITAGCQGAYYYSTTESGFCPGYKVKVADTVGAGDAFSAGLLHSLDKGESLRTACDFACRMGALIAGKSSSIPAYTWDELTALSSTCKPRFE